MHHPMTSVHYSHVSNSRVAGRVRPVRSFCVAQGWRTNRVASSTSPGLVLTCGTCVCCLTVGGRWRNRRSPVNHVEIMWPTPPVMSVLSFSASSLPLAPDHSSKSSVFQSFSNCPTIHHFPPSVWFQTPGFLSNPRLFRKEESFFVARCSQRSSTAVNQTTS